MIHLIASFGFAICLTRYCQSQDYIVSFGLAGWHTYFWIAFIPLIVSIMIGFLTLFYAPAYGH